MRLFHPYRPKIKLAVVVSAQSYSKVSISMLLISYKTFYLSRVQKRGWENHCVIAQKQVALELLLSLNHIWSIWQVYYISGKSPVKNSGGDIPNSLTDGVDYQLIVYYILPASIPVIMFIIGLVYMCKNNCHLKISCECCKVTKPILV